MNTRPKKVVFTVMPFSKEYDNVYKLAIKPGCKESDIFCERLDEQIFTKNMLSQIHTQIFKADFIIADMSEKNPNVFYEVGYAHAFDKNVILITNNGDDIPFDLKQIQHIKYDKNDLTKKKTKIVERLNYFIENKRDTSENDFHSYNFSIDGEIVTDNSEYLIEPTLDDEDSISFNFDISNPTNKEIENTETKIYFIVPRNWASREFHTIVEKDFLSIYIGNIPNLLPHDTESLPVDIQKIKNSDSIYYDEYTKIIIRMINKQGKFDKEIKIKFKKTASALADW
jgi:nucleoside 2-deoxyribosyltransferase